MLVTPSINVLIVDNDITILQRCRELVLNEGHKVQTAESVKEALNIVQKHPGDVDIMLLSLELPKWGGMSLVETLQKARSAILIMTMSANCGEEAIEAMHAGAYDCIRKSFTTERFWTKMNRAIEALRLRRQLEILTEQRRGALSRKLEANTLMCILNSLTYGLVVTDGHTNVVLFNEKAARIFDLTEEQVLFRSVSDCEKLNEFSSFFERAVKSDSSLSTLMAGEEPVVKTGAKMLRIHADPVKNRAGAVIGAAALFHDVTRVSTMDQLRGDFFSMVSHELKSPLSSLLMQLSVVVDGLAGELTTKQADLLGKAKEKTKGMITLVNDILDYRRIQEGKSIQKIERLDVADILNRTVELMRLSSEEKGLNVVCDISEKLPAVTGDRGGVEAVFVNLISNAIKYTPKGGNVNVSLNREGKGVRFMITDTGVGIQSEDIDRIFEKFYRIKTEETRSVSGTGLGLSIVKGIVDAHNGVVHVESEVGEGTTFIVSLPAEP